MAKLKGPLFSIGSSGSVGKEVTYSRVKGRNIGLKYNKPGDIRKVESSPKQKDQRSIIGLITIRWQCFTPAVKKTWNDMAKLLRKPITGYSYFIRLAQTDLSYYLGLVGYWTMNYNIDEKILDLSGNGNHGTLSPTYPSNCPTLVDSFDKKHGKALSLDGIEDYMEVVHDPSLSLTIGLTFICLIRPTKSWATTMSMILSKKRFEAYGFSILWNQLRFSACINSVMEWVITPFKETNYLNKYSFIAATYDGNDMVLYINGIEANRVNSPGTIGTNTQPLRIGSFVGGAVDYFGGTLDDVLIFNRALSEQEIKRNYGILI